MKRICVSCDAGAEMQRFEKETLTVSHRGASAKVHDLSGFRCPACGEIEFDRGCGAKYAAASDELVIAARQRVGEELRRVRKKLGLTQLQASKLTGGGHNAFSRYETGKVVPTDAVINLFRLLERHPEHVEEFEELKRA